MTHEHAVKAIDAAIYQANENLEDAQRFAAEARANANRAKAAWEKQDAEAERKQSSVKMYRDELSELQRSRRALMDHTIGGQR